MTLYGAETWSLRKTDQIYTYLGSFEMWCWRRLKKISWAYCVRNEELLHTVKEDRNVLYTTNRRKTNWIGQN